MHSYTRQTIREDTHESCLSFRQHAKTPHPGEDTKALVVLKESAGNSNTVPRINRSFGPNQQLQNIQAKMNYGNRMLNKYFCGCASEFFFQYLSVIDIHQKSKKE
ncbi:hypothetical protein PUN28_013665 [Cardiocondyla obscurior]|uniref:Uncharacterized protein n=1 Tax=Cardiocondyla obscurior TaxID=286306 RepID=A0AAW2F7N5_9HYME